MTTEEIQAAVPADVPAHEVREAAPTDDDLEEVDITSLKPEARRDSGIVLEAPILVPKDTPQDSTPTTPVEPLAEAPVITLPPAAQIPAAPAKEISTAPAEVSAVAPSPVEVPEATLDAPTAAPAEVPTAVPAETTVAEVPTAAPSAAEVPEVTPEAASDAPVDILAAVAAETTVNDNVQAIAAVKLEDTPAGVVVEAAVDAPTDAPASVEAPASVVVEVAPELEETTVETPECLAPVESIPETTPAVPVETPVEAVAEVPAPVETEPLEAAPQAPAEILPEEILVEAVAEVAAPIETPAEAVPEVPAPVEVSSLVETSATAPVVTTTEVSEDVPVVKPAAVAIEIAAPVEVATPSEVPVPVEAVAEVVESTEIPALTPAEATPETTADTCAAAPVGATVENPTDTPVDAPEEVPAEVVAPSEVLPAVEVPVPVVVGATSEVPTDTLAEAPIEVAEPTEVPVLAPVESTPEITTDAPTEPPVETPVEVVAEAPVETPVEAPVEVTVQVVSATEVSAPAPVEAIPEVTTDVPAETPIEVSVAAPEAEVNAAPEVKTIGGSDAVAGARDNWIWHKYFDNDLKGIPGLTEEARQEVLTTAWEYSRIIIPQYSNWERFSCWVRFMIIGILAEYEGSVLDIAISDKLLGYDVEELLNTMLRDRPGAEDMKREYRSFLLVTSDKCSDRRDGELFRRYVDHLASSPRLWFRARDCDALARFTIAAALCSNDIDDVWFTEEQLEVLGEIGVTLYDAVAFFKHRSEGETNNTFGYINPKHRAETYKRAREVLFAFDAAWGFEPRKLVAVNFLRPFGGPLHMMMRRYRYVEDGMLIGKEEDEDTVEQTRQHYKLWHRVDLRDDFDPQEERYRHVIAQKERLLYPGLAESLESETEREKCDKCVYRKTYGTINIGEFGGVKLCEGCEDKYNEYAESLPERAAAAFPELLIGSQLKVRS